MSDDWSEDQPSAEEESRVIHGMLEGIAARQHSSV